MNGITWAGATQLLSIWSIGPINQLLCTQPMVVMYRSTPVHASTILITQLDLVRMLLSLYGPAKQQQISKIKDYRIASMRASHMSFMTLTPSLTRTHPLSEIPMSFGTKELSIGSWSSQKPTTQPSMSTSLRTSNPGNLLLLLDPKGSMKIANGRTLSWFRSELKILHIDSGFLV